MNLNSRIFLTLTLLTSPLCADFLDDYENGEPHFLEMIDETNDTQFNIIDSFVPDIMLKTLPDFAIVAFLVGIGAIPILEEDFFLSTNRPARRSLLDMPLFQPNVAVFPCPSFLDAQLFFN